MVALSHRSARTADAAMLGQMNQQLIEDEGHRNRMSVPELERRMRAMLEGDYTATLFEAVPRSSATLSGARSLNGYTSASSSWHGISAVEALADRQFACCPIRSGRRTRV